MHIVQFDSSQRIQLVRLYWDQGSLLKLVDVIGSRARNWPIRDGKDQARLIASSAAAVTPSNGPAHPEIVNASENTKQAGPVTTKPRSQSSNVTRDPHASLDLFAPRQEEVDSSAPASVAPRASAKPPPRDYHDLFVGNESDASPVSREKMASPQKDIMTPGPIAPKGGAGKNYQPSRLFENDNSQPGTPSTPVDSSAKFIKPDPTKYNHFEFGDGNETNKPIAARPKSKHQNNWDFTDFMTPEKVPTKIRGQDVRHFGWSDEEPVMDSPAKHPAVAKSRPDANANFSFQDDANPGSERRTGYPGDQGNAKGLGMYQNNVLEEIDLPPSPEKRGHPLANLKDRRKNFDPHFSMTDDSPSQSANFNILPVPEAISSASGDKENILNGGGNKHVGIKSGGDGMGGKRGAGRSWGFGDDSPGPQPFNKSEKRIIQNSGEKENIANGGGKNHVGVKNGGDGMGGKRGAGRSWGFGDDSDEDGIGGMNGGKFRASKIQQAPKDSGFWDF